MILITYIIAGIALLTNMNLLLIFSYFQQTLLLRIMPATWCPHDVKSIGNADNDGSADKFSSIIGILKLPKSNFVNEHSIYWAMLLSFKTNNALFFLTAPDATE